MTSALLTHLIENAYRPDLHSYFKYHSKANLETAAALESETFLADPMQLSSLVSVAMAQIAYARRLLASPSIERRTERGMSARTLRAVCALMLNDPRLPSYLVPAIMNSPGSGDYTVKNAVELMSDAGNAQELRAIIFDKDASPRALAAIASRFLQDAPRLNPLHRTV